MAFVNAAYRAPAAGKRLHVYLEGDGRPWATPRIVARDPTPRRALALELMAADPTPSLYLARPCYFGGAGAPPCQPRLWTAARYSTDVVKSMAAALTRGARGFDEVLLIGYSGGGALAVLIAAASEAPVAGIITLAANLDVEAWTSHHGYHRLWESQNPMSRLPELAHLPQLHVFGADDEECPPELFAPALERLEIPHLTVPGFDHRCCWVESWPRVLATLRVDPDNVAGARAAWRESPDAARALERP